MGSGLNIIQGIIIIIIIINYACRPITKEEKEQENNKKSTPLQTAPQPQKPRVPGQAYLIDNKDEISALPARFSNIRHHLERTTGPGEHYDYPE